MASPGDNASEPYYIETENLLKKHWNKVEHLHDIYKEKGKSDTYFSYYNAEFDVKASFGTERLEQLEHRFDSWSVADRIKP